jgi:hypothetical protein
MEMLLLAALALAMFCALAARRHVKAVAWTRELDRAFGIDGPRDIPRHRTL